MQGRPGSIAPDPLDRLPTGPDRIGTAGRRAQQGVDNPGFSEFGDEERATAVAIDRDLEDECFRISHELAGCGELPMLVAGD